MRHLYRRGRLIVTFVVLALFVDLALVPMTESGTKTILILLLSLVVSVTLALFIGWLDRLVRRLRRRGWYGI